MTRDDSRQEEAGSGLFEMLLALRETSRGRKHALNASVPATTWELAFRFVDACGADTVIEGWLCADHTNRVRRVGAPEKVSPRAFLVTAFACAFAGLPPSYTTIHHVLTADLPEKVQARLGLTTDPAQLGYTSVTRTAAKVTATCDPRTYPTRRALTAAEVNQIDANRDPGEVARKQARADQYQSLLLRGTFNMLPCKVRRAWRGDLTADATVVPTFGKRGHPSRRRIIPEGRSPEVLAGWHAKTQDRRDKANNASREPSTEYTFGYDAHLAMMTNPPGAPPVPPLVLALSCDTPSYRPGLNLAAALAPLVAEGNPVGTMTVDLGYSQLLPENYGLRMRALGYELMHGIKDDQRGKVQAHENGVICLENRLYGPCLPAALRTATEDHAAKRIDDATYDQRLRARAAYEMRTKTTATDSTLVLRCPGAGAHRTAACPLKAASATQEHTEARAGRVLPLVLTTPTDPPPCCTNRESVSVAAVKFAPYVTKYAYNTPEYLATYRAARNQMEGRNGYLKNPLGADIAAAGLRRFRGWGKQFLAILSAIVTANIRAILAMIDTADTPPEPRRRRGRPTKPGLADYRPDPHGPPVRIIGPDKPIRTVA